jgi:O-Antigen ligase
MLFCLIYGFFFSAFVPTYFAFFMFPLIALGLLVIWALPDVNWAPTRTLGWLFYATFISLIVWLPGLPWITLIRLTSFPLNLTLLTCISMSADFRADLMRALRSIPAIPILLGIFVIIQLLSIGLSKDMSSSIQKFVVAQTTWTSSFFAGAYIFLRPGQFKHWAMIMWAMAVFVSLIAILESRIGHVLWLGHIPSILKIDDESVQTILKGKMRSYTNIYRAQATFSTPLGLAEYLALTLPFVMHFATNRFSRNVRIAAFVSLPIILYGCFLTNAKLGMVGSLVGILLYVFGVSFQNWRRNKHSLVAVSFLMSYPFFIALTGAAMLLSHRFSVLILGNDGSHAASTEGRIEQYTMGWHKFLEWPFGYGIGMGAATLGFGEDRGGITIDTYYLSILLEYGIAGFIIYYGMFAIAIYEAGRRSLFAPSDTEHRTFILPITISLIAFVIIKSVFSQQDNHPVVFMMLGALMALVVPYQKTSSAPKSNTNSSAVLYRPPQTKHR